MTYDLDLLTYDLDGILGYLQLLHAESVLLELLGDQVSHGDVHLLLLGVSGDGDQLHAIQKGCGDGCHAVGCGDEENLGQVKWRVQVTGGRLSKVIN